MEWGCIGFLLGAVVCLVFFGMGVCYGGCDSKQPDDDSDADTAAPEQDCPHGGKDALQGQPLAPDGLAQCGNRICANCQSCSPRPRPSENSRIGLTP